MIGSRQDYLYHLEADRIALERTRTLSALLMDEVWTFQRVLRRVEFLLGTDADPVRTLLARVRLVRLGARLGFSVPPGVFGPGLSIAHYGSLVVNEGARVGRNCRLHDGVTLGTAAGQSHAAPTIGDDCFLATGAKVIGPVVLGPRTVVGANAVVTRSFPEGGVTLGGIPARVISDKDSTGLLVDGAGAARRSGR